MEYEKIKKLMDDMGESKLTALDIDFPDGTKISMKKEDKAVVQTVVTTTAPEKKETEEKVVVEKEEEKVDDKIITAPMVGTFYLKPDPNSAPFVEIGKKVKKGDIVCIIEAMKLMNEIESEFDGEIVEVLVEDGKPVEYGTPLFRVQ